MVVIAHFVGVVVAVDKPDVCLAADRRELHVQRSLRLQVAQQDDGFRPHAFDSFKHRLEVAMRIPKEEDAWRVVRSLRRGPALRGCRLLSLDVGHQSIEACRNKIRRGLSAQGPAVRAFNKTE